MRIVYWAKMQLARTQLIAALQAVPDIELVITATVEETLAALPGALGLILVHGPQHEAQQVFAHLRAPGNTVRWLHFISAGREGYEEIGWPPGVIVSYAGGGVSPTVAEHAMALMLALARRVPDMVNTIMAQRAFDRTLIAPKARSLEGATLAIVGFGHIGRELARRAKAFGMRVLSVSRSAAADQWVDQALPMSDLDTVLSQADVVVLAIALTPDTTHLINEARLARCKRGALMINIARGPVVDQAAVVRALHSGQLGGLGTDVSDPEPLPADDPLWQAPNVLISPHFGGSGSPHSMARIADGAADNLRRLIAGEPLSQVVSAG